MDTDQRSAASWAPLGNLIRKASSSITSVESLSRRVLHPDQPVGPNTRPTLRYGGEFDNKATASRPTKLIDQLDWIQEPPIGTSGGVTTNSLTPVPGETIVISRKKPMRW